MATLIFPLIARSFTFLRGPIFYFSETSYLSSVNDADHGTILRYCPDDYQGALKSPFRCIYHHSPDDYTNQQITDLAKLLSYTLNCFSTSDAVDIPVSITIEGLGRRRTAKFISISSTQLSAVAPTIRYRLVQGTNAADLQKMFSLVSGALQNDRRVAIMIDRFNSSLRRQTLEDKIIDLSVALEAMLNENTEVMFRLSLYLAFASQQDRTTAYDLFRTLYNVRSRIVHGSLHEPKAQRDLAQISERMSDIIKYSKAAMLYYFTYLNTPGPRDWSKHCLNLVLGADRPVIGND